MTTDGVTVGRSAGYLRGWLIFILACLLLAAAVAIWAPPGLKLLSIIIAMFAPFGLCAYIFSRAERFTLYPDRIEQRGLFRTRSRRLDEIISVSAYQNTLLVKTKGRGWSPTLPFYVFKDPTWLAWIETVRNTDVEAFEKARAAVDADDVLGGNVEERRQTADRRAEIGRWIGLATCALAFWASLWPRPDFLPVYICCAVPLLAVILSCAFPTVFRVLPGAAPTRIDLGFPASMASLGLVMASFASPTVDWPEALAVSALGGAVAAIVAAMLLTGARVERIVSGVLTGVIVGCYIWGGGVFLNIREDNQPPMLAEVRVTDTSGSLRDKPALSMDVAAAEPFKVSHERVPMRTFAAHEAGQPLCAIVHPGRLGWRWMRVWPCREIIRPVSPAPGSTPTAAS